ncbi:nucleotidyltransferase family protein [Fodinisporobacter ferrooxydans]|uniref:Nucleotidyltransferase family protein n=1 Tax=Fodinisporobacter ferrooxydans TaxID=2901836 RepID=A0ABY4CJ38_9BACL|nr:nucleotidyltransferase family protein [Alicyclobacillaceae bacterium MYW30-H2]
MRYGVLSVRQNNSSRFIMGVFLAAGNSNRMGTSKLALPFCEKTVGSLSLSKYLASQLQKIAVVTQTTDTLQWMDEDCFAVPVRNKWMQVCCQDAKKGMSHSLRCGVLAAQAAGAEGIVIGLADQPFVTTSHINRLCEVFEQKRAAKECLQFVCFTNRNLAYPPVLFAASLFPELLQLKGDQGAGRMVQTGFYNGMRIEDEGSDWYIDVDTPEDYQTCLNIANKR